MTLSRYDEWSGTFGTGNNQDANYGLYAFRDPHTAYPRAYWHPGIGIWQYDSAGLGAPLTTIEAMDVRVVAGDVASEHVAARYCRGHPATDQQRRYAAWARLGLPVHRGCEGFFEEMIEHQPALREPQHGPRHRSARRHRAAHVHPRRRGRHDYRAGTSSRGSA